MSKKNAIKPATPIQMTPDDDLLPEYDIDYSKAKPNRFAGMKHIVIGPVPDDYEKKLLAQKSANGSRAHKTVVAKRVYLYPHQIKILKRVDKNFSAAVRKLIDAYKM